MNNKLGMSMVLTCYNRERFIKEAILSCFAQDYEGPMQLVIVDDASTDSSLKIIQETIQEFGQGWDVEVITLPENRGVAGATDAGWARAKHEWILIVDGDDVQCPERCSIVEKIAQKYPDAMQISCAMKCIDENGNCFNEQHNQNGDNEYSEPHVLSMPSRRYENLIGCTKDNVHCIGASLAFHRSVRDKWGPLCQGVTAGTRFEQDPALALRAALLGTVVGVAQYGVYYRMHDSNLSNIRLSPGIEGVKESERFQEKYQTFHAASLVCMLRDLEHAKNDSRLTDWPEDLINTAIRTFHTEQAGCMLRSMWWSVSYVERLRRLISNWRMFRQSGTSLLRLLPFPLFCLLKYWKQKREWSKR